MGRRIDGQGQGPSTSDKISAFSACEGFHLRRESAFLEQLRTPVPYFHIDLNAGSGHNTEAGVKGTPETFLTLARKYPQVPIQAWFIEKRRRFAAELTGRLQASGLLNGDLFGLERTFSVRCEPNATALRRLVSDVSRFDNPAHARGCLISDPNGWSPKQGALDLPTAAEILARLPQFMVLISFFWSRAKGVRGYKHRGERSPVKHVAIRRVSDHFALRPHWLISEPSGAWCYLCGTSRPYPDWSRPGDQWRLVNVTSPRGRELLRQYDELSINGEAVA